MKREEEYEEFGIIGRDGGGKNKENMVEISSEKWDFKEIRNGVMKQKRKGGYWRRRNGAMKRRMWEYGKVMSYEMTPHLGNHL